MPEEQALTVTHCPVCDAEVQKAGLICPHCGTALSALKDTQPLIPNFLRKRERSEKTSPRVPVKNRKPRRTSAHPPPRRRKFWFNMLVILLGLVFFVGVMAGAAYGGIYVGERDREAKRNALIQAHYDSGIDALNLGNFELAAAEFDYILQIESSHPLAKQGLAEARARLEVKPTPTLEVAESLAEQLLEQAQTSFVAEDWVSTARTC